MGNAAMIGRLLAAGASLQATNYLGDTPLHMACIGDHRMPRPWRPVTVPFNPTSDLLPTEAGRVEVVCMLLGAGVDVDARNHFRKTPLQLACRYGHLLLIEELLSRGAVPTAQDNRGWAPLHTACFRNRAGMASRLLQHDTAQQQLQLVTYDGATALMLASRKGRDLVVPLLLAAGADRHALHVAAAAGNQRDLELLLGALTAGQPSTQIDSVLAGRAALHRAVQRGHTNCVEVLLAAGADPNKLLGPEAVDGDGNSIAGQCPLFQAVVAGHAAAIPLLANPTSMSHAWRGRTPLHEALLRGAAHMAQLLIAAGSPAGLAEERRDTAMSLAMSSSKPGIMALLPAMVQGECQRHRQQQEHPKLPQQRQLADGEGGQQERVAVPAAVRGIVYVLLTWRSCVSELWHLQRAVSSISMVLDVLGPNTVSHMLQWVQDRWLGSEPAAAGTCSMRLLQLAHTGWLAALEPLLHRRQTVTSRLQSLVTQPQQQQQQHRQQQDASRAMAGDGQQQASIGQQKVRLCKQLWAEALAAGDAGDWGLLVQRLEQLAGLQPPESRSALYAAAAEKGWLQPPALVGLCEALLGAWAAGRQHAARRAVQEVADGVVRAVQAWGVAVAQGARRQQRQFS
jgi:ankyrin repeat protein